MNEDESWLGFVVRSRHLIADNGVAQMWDACDFGFHGHLEKIPKDCSISWGEDVCLYTK